MVVGKAVWLLALLLGVALGQPAPHYPFELDQPDAGEPREEYQNPYDASNYDNLRIRPCNPNEPLVRILNGEAPDGTFIVRPGQIRFPTPRPIIVKPGAIKPPTLPLIVVKPAPIQPPIPAPIIVKPPPVQPLPPPPIIVKPPPVHPPQPKPITVRPTPVPVPKPASITVQPPLIQPPLPDLLIIQPPKITVPQPPTICFKPNPPTSFRALGIAKVSTKESKPCDEPEPSSLSSPICSCRLLHSPESYSSSLPLSPCFSDI